MIKTSCQAQDCDRKLPQRKKGTTRRMRPEEHYEQYGNFCAQCCMKASTNSTLAKRERAELRKLLGASYDRIKNHGILYG